MRAWRLAGWRKSVRVPLSWHAASGFGVLELLMALFLIAMLVVLLLPTLERYQKVRDLKQAGRRLLGDVRLAQQHAVTLDENVRLVYSAGPPQGYTIQKVSGGSLLKQVDLPASLTVAGSYAVTPLEFSANGAPTLPGAFCLTEGTQTLRLDVAPATGRTQLSEVSTCP